MWLDVNCSIRMDCPQPTSLILVLRPRSDRFQWVVTESFHLQPTVPATEYLDGFGNLCQRLVTPTGPFDIATSACVRTAATAARAPGAPYVPVPNLPDATLLYLMPSRFCEADRLGGLAQEVIGDATPGFDQVTTICDWVHSTLRYLPESDPSPVSAAEVRRRGEGVCRDFAHLGIALCRSINIPARIAVGYVQDLEPMDLHAWFEAFVGDGWYTFDPTHPRLNTARAVVARGRDAADVPVFNQFGPRVTPSAMTVTVTARPET